MSYNEILYRKDSKGKIRSLKIEASGDSIVQTSGLVSGKKVTHEKVCKPKNVGKSNATTAAEQAIAQCKALYIKKVREGYFMTEALAAASAVLKPMLAEVYDKFEKKIPEDEEVIAQPKLDGIRCVVKYDGSTCTATATSRTNVPITTIPHILKDIVLMRKVDGKQDQSVIFDGELYVHGKTFQEVTKLVKNAYDPNGECTEYHIYDIVDDTKTCEQRLNTLTFITTLGSIKSVPYRHATKDALEGYYREQFGLGYEGIMVRRKESAYKINGRSQDLLKYKKFYDIALPIVDVTPSDSRPEQGTVWIEYKGIVQKTGSKLSHADREELLINKDAVIGKTAEIRYFEETDSGKLRFAYFHGIRFDK